MRRVANVVSGVIHPFFIPLFGVCALLFFDDPYEHLYFNFKLFILGSLVLYTLLIPVAAFACLKRIKVIDDYDVLNERQRQIPILITLVSYLLCAFTLSRFDSLIFVDKAIYALVAVAVILMVISRFWRISVHAASAGWLLALMIISDFMSGGMHHWLVIGALVASGMVLSARLYTQTHNPAQVATGFSVGLFLSILLIIII